MSFLRKVILFLILGCVFAAGGCDISDIQLPWEPLPATPEAASKDGKLPAPGKLVAQSLDSRAYFTSMVAKAGMRIIDRKNDFGLSVNTDIFAGSSPDRLRIQATKASIEAFDAVIVGDDIMFYVKRRRTLYEGKVADLDNEESVSIRPNEILENLLQPDMHLGAREWKIVSPREKFLEIGDAVVLEEKKRGDHWKLYIEPSSFLILAVEKIDAKGAVSFVKTYDRYRELIQTIKGKKTRKWYPFRVKLEWPLDERSVEIKFRSIEPEAVLTDDMFLLAVPERTRAKPIGQVRVESDKISDVEKDAPDEDEAPKPGAK
ncbi:MAG: DUF4292 domain-containing protein [Planctomycetes bacterium]|nr:DUF4292 domain-containing protein [Planctomycetota bacterium]